MDSHQADPHLRRFAAAVVHELRTPLSALSGEVEIALRRERSPAAYREMLERVDGLVRELADLSRDLAIYADLVYSELFRAATSRLSDCVDAAVRCHPGLISLTLDDAIRDRQVVGDQSLLSRALVLLLNHAVRHRPLDATVRVSCRPATGPSDESVELVIDASPGFSFPIWAPLPGASEHAPIEQAAMFRLPTAARIIAGCGGSVDVQASAGSAAVTIRLLGSPQC